MKEQFTTAGFLLPKSTSSQRAGGIGPLWGLFSGTGSKSRRGAGLQREGGLVHFPSISGFVCGNVWTQGIASSFRVSCQQSAESQAAASLLAKGSFLAGQLQGPCAGDLFPTSPCSLDPSRLPWDICATCCPPLPTPLLPHPSGWCFILVLLTLLGLTPPPPN